MSEFPMRDGIACLKNWRTSLIGILLIVIAIAKIIGFNIDHFTTSPDLLLTTGFGFLFAKDAAK